MKYNIYKSDRESIVNDLEALEGVFVFPSHGYELSDEDSSKFVIECILVSYDPNNDKPFQASFLKHLARLDEHTFYAVLETDELDKERGYVSPSGSMISFIASLNYHPFFVTGGTILTCGADGEPFEDHRYGNIDRFVGNDQFNPFFILLDDLEHRYSGETEYQTKKFENAVIALRWIISYGFPYKRIIDWDKNKIIDVHLFSWNNVPGNDNKRLLRYLKETQDVGWAESAEICKSDDGKTIRTYNDENSAEIVIGEVGERVTLKISDGRTHDLKVKRENGELSIYIDAGIREKVMANDVPFDTNFIVGNPEYRFCRLIRFGLKEFMLAEKQLLEKLLNLDLIDPASSLLFFEIVKEPITDRYITNVQSLSNIFIQSNNKNTKILKIFSPAFTVSMRISQPEGFTEKFLEEVEKPPTILGEMRWNLKPVKTLSPGKQRYEMSIYAERRINILELSKTLEEIRRICIRLLINSDLDETYLTPSNVRFSLDYLEITMPNINQEITKRCKDMFDKEFGAEQEYSKKFKRLSDPKEDEIMFRMGFGFLSVLVVDWLTEDQESSARLDRSDPFTKAAIGYALSGSYRRSLELLREIDELFNVDRNSDMPSRFHNYIINNERNLIPYLTKKHPMVFMPDENYNFIKEDVEFFINNYEMFKDVNELAKNVIESREEIIPVQKLYKKLKLLGIYKEKDLSYLDDVCSSISLFFGAQYRKSLQSA